MIKAESKRRRRHMRRDSGLLLSRVFVLLSCAPCCLLTTPQGTDPTSDEILARVANSAAKQRTIAYSGVREYTLHNFRFDKEAIVSVQVSYRSDAGTKYTVLERSGSTKLAEVIEKLLDSEVDATKPSKLGEYEIGPVNYEACLRGTEFTGGRDCYVIDLVPKHKSRYLIKGTAWVDRSNYGVVRLEGATAASVSMLVGSPHVKLEFSEIDGFWLPFHTGAVSAGLFLGRSELQIRYSDYFISDLGHQIPSRAADSAPQSRP